MDVSFDLWLEYILRFSHLVAGIAWIGSSFYFIWLDSSFLPPENPRHNVDGEVFMVHGGFYYQVEKKKIAPGELPKILHWFKWEATLTWITGFLLFIVLYYLRGASLLIDPRVYQLSQFQAISLSFSMIVVSWLVYDFLWTEKFVNSKKLSGLLSGIFFAGLIFFSTQIFSGRGAFILIGAVFGTLMLLNVWIRILPGQTKMLNQARAGETPDYSVSLKSKVRSVHNTYLIFPVLFIMLSNHYPALYNHETSWMLLIILCVSGAMVRHAMVTKNPIEKWTLAPASLGFLALIYMTASQNKLAIAEVGPKVDVKYSQVSAIIKSRCLSCHSNANTDDIFTTAPNGVVFETKEQILKNKDKIIFQVVTNKVMPLANKTNMSEEERAILNKWLTQELK